MPLSEGQTFAGYRIVRLLGSGGMGEVYLAQHPRLPRQDALKVLPADVSADPEYRARFDREADLASKLWHPHIVSVHDRGEYNGQLWISMDYVDGLDAARLLSSRYPKGMPVGQVVRIVTAVASALDYAHKQGLLHRDVKPANIMLTHPDDDEEEQRVLLADFGIARNIDDISGLTVTNMTVGTVAYSAPEQLKGEELDGRADEYALAATAYQLLTGSQLFPYSNRAVVISHHLNAAPPALADARPELAALEPVLARGLAKNPDDRFPRCTNFAHALASAWLGAVSRRKNHAPAEQSSAHGSPSPVAVTKPAPFPSRSKTDVPQAPAARIEPPQRISSMSGSRRQWLILAATAILLAAIITLFWRPWESEQSTATRATSVSPPIASSTTASAPPSSRVFPAKAIDSVLLSPRGISAITGSRTENGVAINMRVDKSINGMSDNSKTVIPPACAGVMYGAEYRVYANSGFVAMRDQTVRPAGPFPYDTTGPEVVEQTVVVFPSAEQAQAVLSSSQDQWRACTESGVKLVEGPEDKWDFNLGEVQLNNSVLTLSMAAINNFAGDRACQQALGVRANVVVGAHSCVWPNTTTVTATVTDLSVADNYAGRLVTEMLRKVTV